MQAPIKMYEAIIALLLHEESIRFHEFFIPVERSQRDDRRGGEGEGRT